MAIQTETQDQPLHLRRSPYLKIAVATLSLAAALGGVMIGLAVHHHYETLKVVAGAFASLLATIVGACLAFWFARLQSREQLDLMERNASARADRDLAAKRQELAFAMHREFSSEEMLRARSEASHLLEAHPDKSYGQLYGTLPDAETRCIFLVSDFYDRLALSVSHHRIDHQLVPELFGAYFVWWWLDVFEQRVVLSDPEWPESTRLRGLHSWVRANSDAADYVKWTVRAREAKEIRMGEAAAKSS